MRAAGTRRSPLHRSSRLVVPPHGGCPLPPLSFHFAHFRVFALSRLGWVPSALGEPHAEPLSEALGGGCSRSAELLHRNRRDQVSHQGCLGKCSSTGQGKNTRRRRAVAGAGGVDRVFQAQSAHCLAVISIEDKHSALSPGDKHRLARACGQEAARGHDQFIGYIVPAAGKGSGNRLMPIRLDNDARKLADSSPAVSPKTDRGARWRVRRASRACPL